MPIVFPISNKRRTAMYGKLSKAVLVLSVGIGLNIFFLARQMFAAIIKKYVCVVWGVNRRQAKKLFLFAYETVGSDRKSVCARFGTLRKSPVECQRSDSTHVFWVDKVSTKDLLR